MVGLILADYQIFIDVVSRIFVNVMNWMNSWKTLFYSCFSYNDVF